MNYDPETNPCETIDIDTLREYMHQHLQETVEKELRNSSQSDTLDNILENHICSCNDKEVKDYLTKYDRIGDILRSKAEEDYEPTDLEMQQQFGVAWHDAI
tara:strand:+ start:192 stop:494 length:303 start_codon:yes stop_codon:yes gene_type:complete